MVAVSADNRQRALTLLVRAYDQARRVLTLLRWSADDLDRIAPSLYAGRGSGRRRADAAASDLPAEAPPATAAAIAETPPAATPGPLGH